MICICNHGLPSVSTALRAKGDDGEPYAKITLNIRDDSVVIHSVETAGGAINLDEGAAETLKFNVALIMLSVYRNTTTWIRNMTWLGVAVPFDNNLNFHKVIAAGIALSGERRAWRGIVTVVLMAIAFTWAMPWYRRNEIDVSRPSKKLTSFDAFRYSHHLFVVVYMLLFVHGIKLYLTP
ncbi:hypothetical protein NL676_006889 [Syzygium grande]|nr:hypothetical protein NL676_006889 [Syzygium grande]